jgi:hypothetical protein
MSPANPPGATPVTADTIAAKIDGDVKTALTAADAATGQHVDTLALVHQARVAHLTRTEVAVSAQFGADSTQAAAAKAAVTTAQGVASRLAVLRRQVNLPQPEVAATGWALHGHVYNDALQPVSAYCVFLVDEENTYQRAYGFAYTDANGYFALNVPAPAAPAKDQAYAAAPPPPPKLFIEVANAKAQPVYLSAAAFEPTLGTATFQNIVLPAGENPIGNPPRAIRRTALPPAAKKYS